MGIDHKHPSRIVSSLDDFLYGSETAFFDEALHVIKQRIRAVEKECAAAQEAGADADAIEWLIDDWSSADSFGTDMAALLLVGVHHWVERWRKRCLLQAGFTGSPPSNAGALQRKLSEFYDLSSTTSYENSLEALRLLANAWKHDDGCASRELLSHLGIDSGGYRILDEVIVGKLAALVGLPADVRHYSVVDALICVAREYVEALRRAPRRA